MAAPGKTRLIMSKCADQAKKASGDVKNRQAETAEKETYETIDSRGGRREAG